MEFGAGGRGQTIAREPNERVGGEPIGRDLSSAGVQTKHDAAHRRISHDRRALDISDEITRIGRERAATAKYDAEQRKLEAEARQFDRNRWQFVGTAMTAGAALFGAGAAFIKLSAAR
jgi:hypothetical protein